MSAREPVEFPEAAREAVAQALGCKPSAHDGACLTHNMPGEWGKRGHWLDCTDAALDALQPHLAEMLEQARVDERRATADAWQWGGWADALMGRNIQERLRNAQVVTDWLRGRAAREAES